MVVIVLTSLGYRKRLVLCRKPVPVGGIIRLWAPECLKVIFANSPKEQGLYCTRASHITDGKAETPEKDPLDRYTEKCAASNMGSFVVYQNSYQDTQSDLEVILEFLEEYYKQNAGDNGKRKAWLTGL